MRRGRFKSIPMPPRQHANTAHGVTIAAASPPVRGSVDVGTSGGSEGASVLVDGRVVEPDGGAVVDGADVDGAGSVVVEDVDGDTEVVVDVVAGSVEDETVVVVGADVDVVAAIVVDVVLAGRVVVVVDVVVPIVVEVVEVEVVVGVVQPCGRHAEPDRIAVTPFDQTAVTVSSADA